MGFELNLCELPLSNVYPINAATASTIRAYIAGPSGKMRLFRSISYYMCVSLQCKRMKHYYLSEWETCRLFAKKATF